MERGAERALAHLDRFLRERVAQGLGPGLSVAVTDRDRLLAAFTYGVADALTRSPVTGEAVFQIGSITKSLTAAALLRRAQAGRLDLDAPVTDYLDWFDVRSPHAAITVHHLLTHTAGLVNLIDTVPSSRYAVWLLRETEVGYPPGAHFHYSNMGYMALGYVLAESAGRPFPEALAEEVLEPLGMGGSVPAIAPEPDGAMASGHEPSRSGPRPIRQVAVDGAHASVGCTAIDLATFLRMLLKRGVADGRRFLREEFVARMLEADAATEHSGSPYGYGYGLFTGRDPSLGGHRIIQHGGENPGFEAVMMGDLDAGVGVALLANSFASPRAEAHHALQILQAASRGGPLPEPPVARAATGRVPEPPRCEEVPEAWKAFVGRYRAHAPLLSDYRVLVRSGRLVLESNGLFDRSLVPLDGTTFRVGEAPHSPERVRFEAPVGGEAQACAIGGAIYARVRP